MPAAPAEPDGFAALKPGAERALEAHLWRLESATDARGQRIDAVSPAGTRVFTFAFAGSQFVVGGGCNSMRGGFAIPAEGRLAIGRLAATMMACEGSLMQADAALAKLVAEPMGAALTPGAVPRLRLVTAGNDTLTLAGRLTHEARYGPATLMFLEVAPRRVPCNPPMMPGATCLQVRDRAFDAQGLPAGTGDWRAFTGDIEGYVHREGERNVVRVKRYPRAPVPADASAFVYVLDLVIESEIVAR